MTFVGIEMEKNDHTKDYLLAGCNIESNNFQTCFVFCTNSCTSTCSSWTFVFEPVEDMIGWNCTLNCTRPLSTLSRF